MELAADVAPVYPHSVEAEEQELRHDDTPCGLTPFYDSSAIHRWLSVILLDNALDSDLRKKLRSYMSSHSVIPCFFIDVLWRNREFLSNDSQQALNGIKSVPKIYLKERSDPRYAESRRQVARTEVNRLMKECPPSRSGFRQASTALGLTVGVLVSTFATGWAVSFVCMKQERVFGPHPFAAFLLGVLGALLVLIAEIYVMAH